MSDEQKTYTASQMREAYMKGRAKQDGFVWTEEETYARSLWPDPEPERRWVKGRNGFEYTRESADRWLFRRGPIGPGTMGDIDDDTVRAQFSLLPRVPVEVTEAIKAKARAAYFDAVDSYDRTEDLIDAALEAVAADLTQPNATTCQHKAQWWGLLTRDRTWGKLYTTLDEATFKASEFDRTIPSGAPHRVIALAEVEE